ncbi:ZYRO0A12936p [Zygosaccharomyces rouxii]|uniref:ZYRO0A12936p n=1 Tax=Zygosaccharomyces rouxii (strain ATCC 2623 / CBS 732 / NBRC 1130 / NCYC 568 / NRRL Y-229) TaxID=559307 RepID=C5DNZ6_ZYGRC|nr:uncharacterized protein ZYRO0A12936g [Zygosaccharomyces rouxii]KAH9198490.1 hypothetical protein LQ764DRAFT_137809 [Zygosaccharomyces rouxii]CAR25987.1 ZYRO0A12936p [Zygosaccharomyces rouxii]
MEGIQLMDFSQELSMPVESLLQPGFFDTWWLDAGDTENGQDSITNFMSAAPASAPATVSESDSAIDLISPQILMPKHQDIRNMTVPPTPGLSLLEQLHMDQPLMGVISNKHKRGYYRCTHCPETFSNIFEYASHMDEFDIRREFKCPFPLCPWKILGLPRRPDLRRHCAIQHKDHLPADLKEMLNLKDETYPTLKCPHQYCDKIFHRKDAYNRHIAIVHEKIGSRFNKRMFQILADCPFDKESDRNRYVNTRMKSRRHSIAIAGIR